jgi:hypothetical protein
MRRFVLLALAAALLAPAAGAATNPEQLYLQKTLKAAMVKAFKKQAPGLKLTTVTCKLPSSGTVARCVAHFAAGRVKGYYPVKATLHESGTMSWTTSAPTCFSATTNKRVAC